LLYYLFIYLILKSYPKYTIDKDIADNADKKQKNQQKAHRAHVTHCSQDTDLYTEL